MIVTPSRAGVPPLFSGEGGDLHDIVAAEMRRVYEASEVPPYLNQKARQFLVEGHEEFSALASMREASLRSKVAHSCSPGPGRLRRDLLLSR